MGNKVDKAYFFENEVRIWAQIRNMYDGFLERYCEFGRGLYVPVDAYQAAFYDYLDIMGMQYEKDLWIRFKEGFMLVKLDHGIHIGGAKNGYPVVLGRTLKRWPEAMGSEC